MPAHRKPTLELVRSGATKKNRKRYAARLEAEPQPEPGLGPPPKQLNEAQAARWEELIANCAPGVLTKQDRLGAEMIAVYWQQLRDGKITAKELAVLNSLTSRYGMTPSDRSKVRVEKKRDDSNPAAKYLGA